MRKRLIRIALVLVVLYGFVIGTTSLLAARAEAVTPIDGEMGLGPFSVGSPDANTAVLFVHGFNGGTDNFEDLPARVAEIGAFAHVMLLPGHGTRPSELRDVTQDELLNAVLSEIRRLKSSHERVVLVGHSMGGTLCALAATHESVDGVVLGAAYFGVTHKWYYGLRPESWSTLAAPIIPWIYKGNFSLKTNDRSAQQHISSYHWIPLKATVTLGQLGEAVREPSVLGAITCPVLMFHSQNDVASAPDVAKRAFEALASDDKELVWIDRSSHLVFWDYDRKMVARRTVEFVKQIQDAVVDNLDA